jgi:hypothetical protein
MPLSKVNISRIAEDSSVTSAKIADDSIVNADINASAAIGTGKTADTFKTQTEATTDFNTKHFNVALLGFKMAVNDSLTVFNLVDGVVDEFHDESGTDEGEGSNDTYCSSNDNYTNLVPAAISAGFTTSTVTEADTSTAGTIPQGGYYRCGPTPSDQSPCGAKVRGSNATFGTFTVPSGMTSVDIQVWGAGGGTSATPCANGGGGGYAEGTLAVTSSQVLHISAGKGGYAWGPSGPAGIGPNSGGKISFFGGGQGGAGTGNGGGGLAGVLSVADNNLDSAPEAYVIAGAGGGGGHEGSASPAASSASTAGAGGGLVGETGAGGGAQVNENVYAGGGGDQEQGGTAGGVNEPGGAPAPQADGRGFNPASAPFPNGTRPGGLFYGGRGTQFSGGGGSGYYGGGGGGFGMSGGTIVDAGGGGGSSYYGHPQVTSGSTEAGTSTTGGGTTQPNYVAGTNETSTAPNTPLAPGEDGFVLLTGTSQATGSTTIVSNAFTASSAPSTSRIVVFQENVDSITLNTDLIASVSRDGGSNFSTVTLADEGYVIGSSGQRILAGVVDISGQPSGTSLRWKLALANNTSKVHGVSLSWA